MNSLRIAADEAAMQTLTGVGGLSVVQASTQFEPDGRWSVVAYAEDDVVETLRGNGFDVTVLQDNAQLEAHWQALQEQVEGGEV